MIHFATKEQDSCELEVNWKSDMPLCCQTCINLSSETDNFHGVQIRVCLESCSFPWSDNKCLSYKESRKDGAERNLKTGIIKTKTKRK